MVSPACRDMCESMTKVDSEKPNEISPSCSRKGREMKVQIVEARSCEA